MRLYQEQQNKNNQVNHEVLLIEVFWTIQDIPLYKKQQTLNSFKLVQWFTDVPKKKKNGGQKSSILSSVFIEE